MNRELRTENGCEGGGTASQAGSRISIHDSRFAIFGLRFSVLVFLLVLAPGLWAVAGRAAAGPADFKGWTLPLVPWGMLKTALERHLPPLTQGTKTEILSEQTDYYYWDSRLDDGRSVSHGFYFMGDRLVLYSKAYDAGPAQSLQEPPVLNLYESAIRVYGKPSIDRPTTAVWLSPLGQPKSVVELVLAEVKEPLTGQAVRLYRIMYYGPNFPGLSRIR